MNKIFSLKGLSMKVAIATAIGVTIIIAGTFTLISLIDTTEVKFLGFEDNEINFFQANETLSFSVDRDKSDISFEGFVKVSENSQYKVFSDEHMKNEITELNLCFGENIIYLKIFSDDNEDSEQYVINIFRENEFIVTFDSDEGSTINPVSVVIDGYINEPDEPIKEGYIFVGWFYDSDLVDFESMSMISEDITLVAEWVYSPNYTGFISDSIIESIFYDYNDYTYNYNDIDLDDYDLDFEYLESTLLQYNNIDMYEGVMHDLARYLGALKRSYNSHIEEIEYNGVIYSWDEELGLYGSNWQNDGVTLVSVIVNDYQIIPEMNSIDIKLIDGYERYISLNIGFTIDMDTALLETAVDQAITYDYSIYQYNYEQIEAIGQNIFLDYLETSLLDYNLNDVKEGVMHDLARYIGALYRIGDSPVEEIEYKGVVYSWDDGLGLTGSNWQNNGATLVSVIENDFILTPEMSSIELTLIDIFEREYDLNLGFNIDYNVPLISQTILDSISYDYETYNYKYNDIYLDINNLYIGYLEYDLLMYNSTDIYEGIMHDLARYLGALYRTEESLIEGIIHDSILYTWDEELGLHGSNWQNNNTTLVYAVVNQFLTTPGMTTLSLDLIDKYDNEFTLNAIIDINMNVETLSYIVNSAINYDYEAYEYNYESIQLDNGHLSLEYLELTLLDYNSADIYEGIMHDLARYLGALHRTHNSSIESIKYNEVNYYWDEGLGLHGSNWQYDGTTLISELVDEFLTTPGMDSVELELIDVFGRKFDLNISFIIHMI